MKKQSILAVPFFSLVVILTACAAAPVDSTDPAAPPEQTVSQETPATADQSNYFWQLNVLQAEAADNLANTQTLALYGGATEDIQYAKTASEGYTFLLLELSVNKNGVGGTPFSWCDVYVEDGQGNRYQRMDNDVFLEDYDLPRLKSTDLTIGSNTGYICLEIPFDTDMSGLALVHNAEEGLNRIPIRFGQ